VVIAGHDREDVRALIFPKPDAVHSDTADGAATSAAYHTDARILGAFHLALEAHNQTAGGSSNRIVKAIVLREPPSIDAGEITDKGYINSAQCWDAALRWSSCSMRIMHATA